MNYPIQITPTTTSTLSKVDFKQLPFGKVFADHMFVADFYEDQWQDFRIIPYGPLAIYPANKTLQYAQTIFEGLKATKNQEGIPLLLCPDKHAQRFNASAKRMCMPPVPNELFLQALYELVDLDREWIPSTKGSALYIRPFMYATEEALVLTPSSTYRFIIFACPVNSYYSQPQRLVTEQFFVRAVKGTTGEAKAGANYALSLLPTLLAQQKGYDQIIWLESPAFKKIQEAGIMNLFFVIGETVITPAMSGAILDGITRRIFIEILRAKGITIEVRDIYIEEVITAYKNGQLKELFGTGTAAVISHVSELTHGSYLMKLPPISERKIAPLLQAEIEGLRDGTIADSHGWMLAVNACNKRIEKHLSTV